MKKIFLFVFSKISSVFSALKVKFLPLKIKHFEGFGYYCHRFFVKTGLSKKLSGIKIGKFNFLNWSIDIENKSLLVGDLVANNASKIS